MIAALRAEGLGKRYGSYWALRDCDFSLEAGRVAALVGPTGSGKSTLLELAIGLLSPLGWLDRGFRPFAHRGALSPEG